MNYAFIDDRQSVFSRQRPVYARKREMKNGRRVHFSSVVSVFPIPGRKELEAVTPFRFLWWSPDECNLFQQEARRDVHLLLSRFPALSPREAINLLYT